MGSGQFSQKCSSTAATDVVSGLQGRGHFLGKGKAPAGVPLGNTLLLRSDIDQHDLNIYNLSSFTQIPNKHKVTLSQKFFEICFLTQSV